MRNDCQCSLRSNTFSKIRKRVQSNTRKFTARAETDESKNGKLGLHQEILLLQFCVYHMDNDWVGSRLDTVTALPLTPFLSGRTVMMESFLVTLSRMISLMEFKPQ
jgi:hypothetical protein